MGWIIPIMFLVIRVGLSVSMYLTLKDKRWKPAFCILGAGFMTNIVNVVLARYGSDTFETDFGPFDAIATGIFQFSVILGLLKADRFTSKGAAVVVSVAVIAFMGTQLPVGDSLQAVCRAILLFNSIAAMTLATWIIAIEALYLLGVAIATVFGASLLYISIAWSLATNNILGK